MIVVIELVPGDLPGTVHIKRDGATVDDIETEPNDVEGMIDLLRHRVGGRIISRNELPLRRLARAITQTDRPARVAAVLPYLNSLDDHELGPTLDLRTLPGPVVWPAGMPPSAESLRLQQHLVAQSARGENSTQGGGR